MENGTEPRPAFIWDLDGTLLDSYEVIVPSLKRACSEFGIELGRDEIYKEVITHTVYDFILMMNARCGVDPETLKKRYLEINAEGLLDIKPIKNAKETLCALKDMGISNYLFTHRGSSTEEVLKNTGIYGCFDGIVTSRDGFKRKPDPEALLYLIENCGLDRANTFYVGDRRLDIECANNAGIRSILYLPENSPAEPTGLETFVIRDLCEIGEIVSRHIDMKGTKGRCGA